MIELNKLFLLTETWGVISDAGVKQITNFIAEQRLDEGDWLALNPTRQGFYIPALPYDWEYIWMIQHGEYRGKFAARVSQLYYKKYNLKCPRTFLERLGNIAREHTQSSATFRFEFVDKIDWKAGDFGESFTSCYWDNGEAALDLLRDNGALAVRFYDGWGKGVGRAWLVDIGNSVYVLWNGYGFAANSTLTIARVVASHLKVSYRRIELTNHGKTGGVLYINSGGYAIGATSAIEKIYRHDFEWGDDCYEHCEHCGDCLTEDDYYRGADDMLYCQDCYYDRFDSCDYCGETYYRDDLTYVEHESVCEYCLSRHFVQCDECYEFVPKGDARTKDDRTLCENCYEDDVEEGDDG